jgi:multidrug efflux pump subunit AcrB
MKFSGDSPRFPAMSGPVRFFANHGTAANLLMALLLIAGFIALENLNTQLLPTRENPRVSVRVSWSGASASDMDKSVIRNLEPALRYLGGVEDFFGLARQGSAYMAIQFRRGMDVNAVLAEVQKAVDGVTTLPEGADKPVVSAVRHYERVAKILVSGPFDERRLKDFAIQIRDGLLAAGIDQVSMTGARDEEIIVTATERNLTRYHLTMADMASAISRDMQDRPAGNLRGGLDRTVHGIGSSDTADEIARITLRAGRGGEHFTLGEVARVKRGFNPDQMRGMYRGQPAIRLEVQRSPAADTLKTNRLLHKYIAKIRNTLPGNLEIRLFDVRANYLQERIALLVRNGLQGLAIVLVVLFVFLNARIAFWVAFGIPVAMMSTLAVMWVSGQTINMFSLFALMLTLGIIVDDAIVVGEHAATLRAQGLAASQASERGALRMLAPVLAATLTTIVAFLPTFFFGGRVGNMMQALPLVVMAALAASLVECFFILPAHLRHALANLKQPGRFRRVFDSGFDYFRDRIFGVIAGIAFDWRYSVLGFMLALLVLSISVVISGKLRFNFFPSPEAEYISASITMQAGTSREKTLKSLNIIETSLYKTAKNLGQGKNLIHTTFAWLGKLGYSTGDHLAQLDVQLLPSEKRSVRTSELVRNWRRAVPPIAGLERFSLGVRRHGGAPRDLEINLKGNDPFALKTAALEIEELLMSIKGVQSVDDDLPWGKRDVRIRLTQRGRALGFNIDEVSAQVRQVLEGQIVHRFARNSEEIVVRIRRAGKMRGMQGLHEMRISSPDGIFVSLLDIADLHERRSFGMIFRRDGKMNIQIGADLDSKILTLLEIRHKINSSGLEAIARKYGASVSLEGGLAEQREGFSDLQRGAMLALALIYIVLAWVFASYIRPFIVMLIIPFSLIGAVAGHMIMGFDLSVLSLVGLLGLAGVVVNDSIILVARADERLAGGETVRQAATGAAQDRLRAVLLTSLTTIGGLAPLLFEKSIQAQFLLPMAITIVFGLAIATFLVLLLVPAVYGILTDIVSLKNRAIS